ncbi:hypothetical protein LARV_03477 [Longilinea arvoryzae]|uniref:Carbohydrate-binding domain-containing protein n=1 Tax=Longilinea arvoryzae TaxID=360412 RepID=A0A0S7BPE0_9CHLR|nr:carbohydrate-binding domain-containing protein [Longilinea arvoryzae]GAP15685.1 hypothetical protein LARV_03477 [Longilinea arvoryzae]
MKKFAWIWITIFLALSLAACSAGDSTGLTQADTSLSSSTVVNESSVVVASAQSVEEAQAENSQLHEEASDYTWDPAVVIPITLNGDSISADATDVNITGSTAIIGSAGTYSLSGTLTDGQIIVDTQDETLVQLILNGVDLHSSTSAPIYVKNARKVVIILADGTTNTLDDALTYGDASSGEDEPNAALFSMADLSLSGSGSLVVNGNSNDGITSKDGLIIAGGTITVTATDDGIRGKDYVDVENGTITVNAGGDGLKSDNEEDTTRGYITIAAGVFDISAGGDAITAQTDVMISGGEFNLTTAGGSQAKIDATLSAKAIKGVASVVVDGGTFKIDAADDALHSNGSITVNDCTFDISTGDDGMHADAALTINNGSIQINQSYEGLESTIITINAGSIQVNSSDDGINGSGGNDGSGTQAQTTGQTQGTLPGGQQKPAGGPGGRQGGGRGQDTFSGGSNATLYIHGGWIVVNAYGDGVDVNGSIEMSGGTLLVSGPVENMNGALDYNGTFNMTGGFLIAAGSAGMAMAPSATSSQNSVLINFNSKQQAGTLVHVQDSAGAEIFTFASAKEYQSIAFSSPQLAQGANYAVSLGGSDSGTQNGGLIQDGTYTPGISYTDFTISSVVTQIGSGGGMKP